MAKKLDIGSKSFIVYKGKIRKAYIVGYISFIERIITNGGLPSLRGLISAIVGLIEKAWKNDWELDAPKLKSTINLKALSVLLLKNLTRTSLEDIASYFSVMAIVAMRTEDKKTSIENVTINRVFASRKEAKDSSIYKQMTKELPEFKFELGLDIKKKLRDAIRKQLGGSINKIVMKGFVRSTIKTLDISNMVIDENGDLSEDDTEALAIFSKLSSNDNWSFEVSDNGDTVVFTKEKFIGGALGVQTLYSKDTIRQKFRVKQVLQDYIDFLSGNFDPVKYSIKKQTIAPMGLAELEELVVIKIENEAYVSGTNPEIPHGTLNDGLTLDLYIHKEKFLDKLVEMGYDREADSINEEMIFGDFVRSVTGKITKGELFSKQLYAKRKHYLSSFEVTEVQGTTSNVFHAKLYMGRDKIFLKSNYVVNVSFTIEHLDNLKFNFLTRFRIGGKTYLNMDENELQMQYFDTDGNELIDLENVDYIFNPVITIKVSELVPPLPAGDSYTFNIRAYNSDENLVSPLLTLDDNTTEVTFDLNLAVFNTKRNNFANIMVVLTGSKTLSGVTNAIRAFDDEFAINYSHNGNNAGLDMVVDNTFTESPISYQDTVIKENFWIGGRDHILLKHLLFHIIHYPDATEEWLDVTPDGMFDKELNGGEVYEGQVTVNLSKLTDQSQGHFTYEFVPIYLQGTQLKLPVETRNNSIKEASEIIKDILNEEIFSFMNNEVFSLVNYSNAWSSSFISNTEQEQDPDNIITIKLITQSISNKFFYGRVKYPEVNSAASAVTQTELFIADFIENSIPLALSYDDLLSGFSFYSSTYNENEGITYAVLSYKTEKNSAGMPEVPISTEILNKLAEGLEDSTFGNNKFGMTLENFLFNEVETNYPYEIILTPTPYMSYLAVKKGYSVFDRVWFLTSLPKIPMKLIREGLITAVKFNKDLSGDFRTVDIKLATADLDYKVLGGILPNVTESIPPKTPFDAMILYTVKDKNMYISFDDAQANAMQIFCPICLTFKNKPAPNDTTFTETLDLLNYVGTLGEEGKAPELEPSVNELINLNNTYEAEIINSTRRFELDRNPSPSNPVSSTYSDEEQVDPNDIDTSTLEEMEDFALPPDTKVDKPVIRHDPPLDKVMYDELRKLSVVKDVAGVSSVSQLIQRKKEKEQEALSFVKSKLSKFNMNVLDLKLLLGGAADHIIICADCQKRIMSKLGALAALVQPSLPEIEFGNPRIETEYKAGMKTYIDLEFMDVDSTEIKEVNTFEKPRIKKQKKILESKLIRKIKKLT